MEGRRCYGKGEYGRELIFICNWCEHLYALMHLMYMLLQCDTTNLLFRKWSPDAITLCRISGLSPMNCDKNRSFCLMFY